MTDIKRLIEGLRKHDAAMTTGEWRDRPIHPSPISDMGEKVVCNGEDVARCESLGRYDAKGIAWLRNNAGAIADALSQSAYPTYAAWAKQDAGILDDALTEMGYDPILIEGALDELGTEKSDSE